MFRPYPSRAFKDLRQIIGQKRQAEGQAFEQEDNYDKQVLSSFLFKPTFPNQTQSSSSCTLLPWNVATVQDWVQVCQFSQYLITPPQVHNQFKSVSQPSSNQMVLKSKVVVLQSPTLGEGKKSVDMVSQPPSLHFQEVIKEQLDPSRSDNSIRISLKTNSEQDNFNRSFKKKLNFASESEPKDLPLPSLNKLAQDPECLNVSMIPSADSQSSTSLSPPLVADETFIRDILTRLHKGGKCSFKTWNRSDCQNKQYLRCFKKYFKRQHIRTAFSLFGSQYDASDPAMFLQSLEFLVFEMFSHLVRPKISFKSLVAHLAALVFPKERNTQSLSTYLQGEDEEIDRLVVGLQAITHDALYKYTKEKVADLFKAEEINIFFAHFSSKVETMVSSVHFTKLAQQYPITLIETEQKKRNMKASQKTKMQPKSEVVVTKLLALDSEQVGSKLLTSISKINKIVRKGQQL